MISHCVDAISNIPYTFDTGSSVSVFPSSISYSNNNNTPVTLYNPTHNSFIPILGHIETAIQIGTNCYTWTFFTADINKIILGRDFIEYFST